MEELLTVFIEFNIQVFTQTAWLNNYPTCQTETFLKSDLDFTIQFHDNRLRLEMGKCSGIFGKLLIPISRLFLSYHVVGKPT